MKKTLFISCALAYALAPSLALGRPYQHPDWLDGSIPVTSFSTFCTTNCPTGTAPMDAYEPAEEPDVGWTPSQWLTAGSSGDYVQALGREKKFRTQCEPTYARWVDGIIGPGIPPPFGHRHKGVGAEKWSENSSYTYLRTHLSSTCAGGPHNNTNYWKPEWLEDRGNGVVIGINEDIDTFYYITGQQGSTNLHDYMRRDTEFISGANPMNFNDTARRAVYAASGFNYPGGPDTPAGIGGWQCFPTTGPEAGGVATVSVVADRLKLQSGLAISTSAKHLRGPTGADPWGGNCQGTIGSPAQLIFNLIAPGCIDAHNLHAPDGRGNFWYAGSKGDSSVLDACPSVVVNGSTQLYRKIPQLTAKHTWLVTGPADYLPRYFSSDRMRVSTTECPDATAPCDGTSGGNTPATVGGVFYSRVSKDPCRQVSVDFCNGATGHNDWIYGWRSATFEIMQRECLGIVVRGIAPTTGPAECGTSQYDAPGPQSRLIYGGASPNTALSGGCAFIGQCQDARPGNSQLFSNLPKGYTTNAVVVHPPHP